MANVYLKFLQNIAALEAIQLKQNELSPTAILLLNAIAVKHFEKILRGGIVLQMP